jgi:hypothetical protein
MVASLRSQPHGGRAFTRHTRPDPRRYGTPPRRCPTPSIRAFGTFNARTPCAHDSLRLIVIARGNQPELITTLALASVVKG